MNLEQYLKESERTLIDKGTELNLRHASLGIRTELGELLDIFKKNLFYNKPIDMINFKEELGDLCWYPAISARIFNFDPKVYSIVILNHEEDNYKTLINKLNTVFIDYANLIDDYSEHLNFIDYEYINEKTKYLFAFIKAVAERFNFTFEDVLETNIRKLRLRFPQKFTEEKALNRDLINERKILEA